MIRDLVRQVGLPRLLAAAVVGPVVGWAVYVGLWLVMGGNGQ